MNKVKEYYAAKRVSNSLLKVIDHNPKLFWLKTQGLVEDEDSTYLRMGSAVDCLLTQPDKWEEEFYVMEHDRPQGLMGKFVESLPLGLSIASLHDSYQEAYEASGYKVPIERVINWFWSNDSAVNYYNQRNEVLTKDVIILDKTEYERVSNAVSLIKENPYTLWYFLGDEPHIERLLQLDIYFEIKGVECKALLDGVVIDHKNKTIQPFDLKTTSKGVFSFENSFVSYGYFRQAAMYTEALHSYIKDRSLYDPDIEQYTLLPFKFIVVDSRQNSTSPALIYNTTNNDITVGLYGGKLKHSDTTVKGVYQLIDDYLWHTKEDKWLLPREIYESKGEVPLNVFYENSKKH